MNFVAARAGEARVWSFYSKWSNIEGFQDMYYDYAGGWNLTNRMPGSVEPKSKMGVMIFFQDNFLCLLFFFF
jgi:hypothetical protein